MTERLETAPEGDSASHGSVIPRPGRGALSNQASRYMLTHTLAADDGWGIDPELDAAPLETIVLADRTRELITRNRSPDIPFDRSINPYKGCEHGCVYCFARPTHAYLDLSPGLDFETRLFYKADAAQRLEAALCKSSYQVRPIAMGTNTDPYQPIERRYRVTRQVLEVLLRSRHPVTLVTKSHLVLDDIGLWRDLAELNLARVAISVTTLDRELKRKLEPRTASPAARLRTMERLAAAGVPVSVMAAPMIPFINDAELERILAAARDAGATAAGYILLRLPLEVAGLFEEWLEAHYPQASARVLSVLRDMRGGALYTSRWGERMRGTGAFADLLAARFRSAAGKLGLQTDAGLPALRTDLFSPPHAQQSLF